MKGMVDMAKKLGLGVGEGFQDLDLREIQELIVTTPEELTEDDLIDVSASEPVPDDEEEDVEEAVPESINIRQSARRF